jgi:hypothetical protein
MQAEATADARSGEAAAHARAAALQAEVDAAQHARQELEVRVHQDALCSRQACLLTKEVSPPIASCSKHQAASQVALSRCATIATACMPRLGFLRPAGVYNAGQFGEAALNAVKECSCAATNISGVLRVAGHLAVAWAAWRWQSQLHVHYASMLVVKICCSA